jgi:hypothetical protein
MKRAQAREIRSKAIRWKTLSTANKGFPSRLQLWNEQCMSRGRLPGIHCKKGIVCNSRRIFLWLVFLPGLPWRATSIAMRTQEPGRDRILFRIPIPQFQIMMEAFRREPSLRHGRMTMSGFRDDRRMNPNARIR